jgi:hypothetical protein
MGDKADPIHGDAGEGLGVPRLALLRAVPAVARSASPPSGPTDLVRALQAPDDSERPKAFVFNAVPGTDLDRLRTGEALVGLAARLVEILNVAQVEEITREIDSLARDDVDIDAVEYERLTGESAPHYREIVEVRVQSLLRAFERRRRLLEDSLTTGQLQELLGVSADFMPKWATSPRRIFAVLDFGQYRFPSWQFDASAPDGVLWGLAAVLAELDEVPPMQQLAWFSTEQVELGGQRPADALRGGQVEAVRSAAQALRYSTAGGP